jgi:hypothetical protein
MTRHSARRLALILLIVSSLVGGCASASGSPAPATPTPPGPTSVPGGSGGSVPGGSGGSVPGGSVPGGSAGIGGPAVGLDQLLGADRDLDGQAVRVTAGILVVGPDARLCAVYLESYPPQCGGGQVILRGDIPPDVLNGLQNSKSQPNLAQASWGQVIVAGIYHRAGGSGTPTIEIREISLLALP